MPLTCALPSTLQKYMEDFGEGRGIWYEKWHSSVLGRTLAKLTAVRRRPNVHPPSECASRHSCGKVSHRLPAACCDFYVRISECIGYVLFCKPASVCWLAPKNHNFVSSPTCAGCHLLTRSVAGRFYPTSELVLKGTVSVLFCSCASPSSLLPWVCRFCG